MGYQYDFNIFIAHRSHVVLAVKSLEHTTAASFAGTLLYEHCTSIQQTEAAVLAGRVCDVDTAAAAVCSSSVQQQQQQEVLKV